jgi:hypothetical protein
MSLSFSAIMYVLKQGRLIARKVKANKIFTDEKDY